MVEDERGEECREYMEALISSSYTEGNQNTWVNFIAQENEVWKYYLTL